MGKTSVVEKPSQESKLLMPIHRRNDQGTKKHRGNLVAFFKQWKDNQAKGPIMIDLHNP